MLAKVKSAAEQVADLLWKHLLLKRNSECGLGRIRPDSVVKELRSGIIGFRNYATRFSKCQIRPT
jgi:hypothetical protein